MKNSTTYDIGNPGHGQSQKCGRVKQVYELVLTLNMHDMLAAEH